MHTKTTNKDTSSAPAAIEQCNKTGTFPETTSSTPGDEVREYIIFGPQGQNDVEELLVDLAHWEGLLEIVSDLFDEGSSVRLLDADGDYVESVDDHLARIGCRVGIRNHCIR